MKLSLILFFYIEPGFVDLGLVYTKSPAEIEEIESEIKKLELEQIYNRRERELENEDNSRFGDTYDPREESSAQDVENWDQVIQETAEKIAELISNLFFTLFAFDCFYLSKGNRSFKLNN